MSAELAKTRLEFYDIKATIADACFYTLGYGAVMDGVRLQVPDADAERAKALLVTDTFIEPPDDDASGPDSSAADALGAKAFQEPAADSSSHRSWPVSLLFLVGLLCLILGRPASAWSARHPFSGPLILAGELLIVTGLWIAYGRLSAAGEHELPPE